MCLERFQFSFVSAPYTRAGDVHVDRLDYSAELIISVVMMFLDFG